MSYTKYVGADPSTLSSDEMENYSDMVSRWQGITSRFLISLPSFLFPPHVHPSVDYTPKSAVREPQFTASRSSLTDSTTEEKDSRSYRAPRTIKQAPNLGFVWGVNSQKACIDHPGTSNLTSIRTCPFTACCSSEVRRNPTPRNALTAGRFSKEIGELSQHSPTQQCTMLCNPSVY